MKKSHKTKQFNKETNKEKREKKYLSPHIIKEIRVIVLIVIAVFFFFALQFKNSMGILGYIVSDMILKTLFGAASILLPLLILIWALSYLLFHSKNGWKLTLFAFFSLLISATILVELWKNGCAADFIRDFSIIGGGFIGYLGLFVFNSIIGVKGTILILSGIIIISLLILFNFSILRSIAFFMPKKNEDSPLVSPNIAVNNIPPNIEIQEPTPSIENKNNLIEKLKVLIPKPKAAVNDISEKSITPEISTDGNSDETLFDFPSINLLDPPKPANIKTKDRIMEYSQQAQILEETLASFGVQAKVIHITPGPSVTRFELEPGVGVKISKITTLSKDIALKLAAPDVRIEAPIPGKSLIGIEVPNNNIETVSLRSLIETTSFMTHKSKLVSLLGLTITGEPVLLDLAKMPHLLIAGATGSGKSVCVNSIILSILFKAKPNEVKFLMIDPKKVELCLYEGIPHLLAPVVSDPNKAAATLKKWALLEMERRYEEFSKIGVRNIEGYNVIMKNITDLIKKNPAEGRNKVKEVFQLDDTPSEEIAKTYCQILPYIVVIIDELADLMMVASQDVETTICRLAQMARATGIHLVVATQRPSVNVVTGLIKANIPSRISFFLQSQIDSRTIIDMPGAEKLLGRGDMLYMPVGNFKPNRIQGVYISEKEIKRVVDYLKRQGTPHYLSEIMDVETLETTNKGVSDSDDELFEAAKDIVLNTQHQSISYLQRKLRIGYNRAARLMEELEAKGLIIRNEKERKN
ncbi:MAG: DNA translocase FtsK 4TM domain-containing protein [Candidatus Margulisiibacteriota bacterium]|jgi:S-DNA-T family DNA segregation ATPase FtsK/SpoIIIE